MSRFDKSLDSLLIAQVNMMDPAKREKAESKALSKKERLRLLQNIVQSQTGDGARQSTKDWANDLVELQKINSKLPKKQRKRNAKFLQQSQETASAVNKGWKTVAEGRAKQAAKF